MKKKILSLLCTVVLLFGLAPTGLALENDSLRAADMLATLHLIADRDYHLSAPVTRAEAAVLLVRVAGSEQAAKNASFPTAFRDVGSQVLLIRNSSPIKSFPPTHGVHSCYASWATVTSPATLLFLMPLPLLSVLESFRGSTAGS